MLAQAFTIKCVGFCEHNSGSSVRNLGELGLEYVLYPPVSGPAIERLILKIKKDEETRASKRASPSQDEASAKGPLSAEAINNSLNSDPDHADADSDSLSHFQGSSLSGMAYTGHLGKEPEESGNKDASYIPGQGAPASGPGDYQPTHDDSVSNTQAPGESFEQWAERMRNAAGAADNRKKPKGKNILQTGPGMGPGYRGGENSTNRGKAEGEVIESEYTPKKKKKAYRFETDSKQDLSNEKLIVRGAQTSLNQTVVQVKGFESEDVVPIERASNIACITIESPRFSGYLVCALGKNRKIDEKFVEEVQRKLVKFLVDNGEPAKEKDTLSMKIQEVDFTEWALQEAEFLRTSVHNGDEIAMAFFPTNDLEVKLEVSASEKMVKLSIDDLKEDAVVEFDLYIFMPGNNKYLLYTPQGMRFYGNQKNRLREKGVSHIHLRKESASSVKKYKAQNFLNEKIESYNATKRSRQGES
jgi:hypothetical protein